ncbi:hypothetical protein RI129_005553 [Pyrocoelia pectoralis]|uniref:Uncharacterized protein n=1 Tax=Pyrocoelia pectoralis TaxID=417401 RepID=A0AAN7VNN3_9COLE
MVDAGYLKAMSDNLPRVDVFMLAEFLKKDDRFNTAEIHGAKVLVNHFSLFGISIIIIITISLIFLNCGNKKKKSRRNSKLKRCYPAQTICCLTESRTKSFSLQKCLAHLKASI